MALKGQETIVDSIRLALSKINKVLGPSSSTACATGHITASTPSNRMKLPKLSIAAIGVGTRGAKGAMAPTDFTCYDFGPPDYVS